MMSTARCADMQTVDTSSVQVEQLDYGDIRTAWADVLQSHVLVMQAMCACNGCQAGKAWDPTSIHPALECASVALMHT